MIDDAATISRRLGDQAESVCRRYLSNGKRQGRYWLVGDVDNTPGRSLYVRLADGAKGPAGKWTDAATGEHGDLLDLIAATKRLNRLPEALDEARDFLSLPRSQAIEREPAPSGSAEAARRLWAISQPIAGTLAETYLGNRRITELRSYQSLRYHSRCYYRGDPADPRDSAREAWPALIAAVRDADGDLTGVHRTWVDPSGGAKAPVSTPRRALGDLLGNGVWFGKVEDTLAAGEGIETMLSLRMALPTCRRSQPSPPITSQRSRCHEPCAASTSLATGTRRVPARRRL